MENNQVQDAVDEKNPLVKETVEKYNQMEANKEQVKIHESVDAADAEQSAIVTEKVEEIIDGAAKKPKCQRLEVLCTRVRNFLKSFRCW